MKIIYLLLLCISAVISEKESYKAATIKSIHNEDLNSYIPLILEAGKSDVDILVLPSQEKVGLTDNYEETIKNLSNAAKQAGVYVAANLFEKILCNHKNEVVKSNIVFDREGKMSAVYKKPVKNLNNCTSIDHEVTFKTEFGVTFGLMMGEDLVLQNPGSFEGLKNFLVVGGSGAQIPFLSGPQLTQSWAYVKRANVISPAGIYSSGFSVKDVSKMSVVELKKDGPETDYPPIFLPSDIIQSEDLSLYSVKPLDMEVASKGLHETVCNGQFCCDFKLKTKTVSKPNLNYMLVAFDGVREFQHQSIGVQNCAIFACSYSNTDACSFNVESNVTFEHININGNFSTKSVQYPMITSTEAINTENFDFEAKITDKKLSKIEISESSFISVGIFGRNFEKDSESGLYSNFYDYLFNENVLDFIDYVWIRLRILIFVVSIYILEMM